MFSRWWFDLTVTPEDREWITLFLILGVLFQIAYSVSFAMIPHVTRELGITSTPEERKRRIESMVYSFYKTHEDWERAERNREIAKREWEAYRLKIRSFFGFR
jgi:hypothetical protein